MSYHVSLLEQAEQDLDVILAWLSERSSAGAAAWRLRWFAVISELERQADRCSLAPEGEGLEPIVRQLIFKTKSGRRYRTLFTIDGQQVIILHVRGPGQDLIPPDELRRPESP